MIPDIGVMIAAYVVTRMLGTFCRPIDSDAGWRAYGQIATRVFAAITIIVAVIVGIDLLLRGATGVSLPELTK